MSPGELYPWLKALHVAAALAFAGGVLAVGLLLPALPAASPSTAATARAVRRWDQAVTTPAMLLVWGLGLALATTGQWFADIWLQLKLVFVLLLSGLHGVQSGRLRRLAGGGAAASLRGAPAMILACLLAIAMLVVVKPF